jgi:hypothetical protein
MKERNKKETKFVLGWLERGFHQKKKKGMEAGPKMSGGVLISPRHFALAIGNWHTSSVYHLASNI